MSNNIANNKLIAKNTIMLYFRMMISMIVSLYTTKIFLKSLGVEDYGIYNVVGGFVTSLSIFTSALSVSISRFITFSIGKGNMLEFKQIFSTAIFIQLIVAIIVFIIAESVGLWFMNTKIVIAADRIYAAHWVYQFSLFSFLITIIGIPYTAVITAYEKMSVYAVIGLIDTFLKFIIALSINKSPIDRLIWYSALLMLSSILTQLLYIFYSMRHFKGCGFSLKPHRQNLKKMLSFSGWSVLGGIAPIARDQGGNILLNIFFGPTVNAARGIANQVCMAINSFVLNFQSAINPQIIKNYASKDYLYLKQLVFSSSKYSCCILLFFAIPIAVNLPYILKLWLNEYPQNTESFIILVFIFNIFEAMSNPLITAAVAIGNMKGYQLRVAPLIILNIPISYLLLKYGYAAACVFLISIVISLISLFIRLKFLSSYISISLTDFIINVLMKVLIIVIISYVFPFYINQHLNVSFVSFITISFFSISITTIATLFIGCTKKERKLILSFIKSKIKTI